MDIVGNVPVEISHKIFSYLRGSDLVRCTLVSRQWFELINCDSVWKNTCVSSGLGELKQFTDDSTCKYGMISPLCRWRCIYREHIRLINRWRKNRCKIYFLTKDPAKCCCSAVFQNTLAFAFSNNEIELFIAGAEGFYSLQSIWESGSEEEELIIQMMSITKEYLAYHLGDHISIYRRSHTQYEAAYRLTAKQNVLFSYDLGTMGEGKESWDVSENDLFTIEGGMLYMRLNHLGRIFIWDLVGRKTVESLEIDEEAVVQFTHGRLLVANGPLISVFDHFGRLCFRVQNEEPVIAMWSNKNIFLAAYFEPHPVRCYSLQTGAPAYKEVKGAGDVVLHPTEDIVYRLPTAEDLSVLGIEAIRLRDSATLWNISLKKDTFVDFSSCKVVMDRFLLLFHEIANTGRLTELCSVYCAKTGRFLYDINDSNNVLALLTDSMIVTTGESVCIRLYKS